MVVGVTATVKVEVMVAVLVKVTVSATVEVTVSATVAAIVPSRVDVTVGFSSAFSSGFCRGLCRGLRRSAGSCHLSSHRDYQRCISKDGRRHSQSLSSGDVLGTDWLGLGRTRLWGNKRVGTGDAPVPLQTMLGYLVVVSRDVTVADSVSVALRVHAGRAGSDRVIVTVTTL